MNTIETLQVTRPSDREVALTRVFNAPRHLVFDALTKPEYIRRWMLGPPGWSMPVCEVDLRVGGKYRYQLEKAGGHVMGMGGVYREIVPPDRLVYTESFDEPWYSGEAVITTTLTERDGRTTMVATILASSKEACEEILKSGMSKGAAMSYDRLAELVETAG